MARRAQQKACQAEARLLEAKPRAADLWKGIRYTVCDLLVEAKPPEASPLGAQRKAGWVEKGRRWVPRMVVEPSGSTTGSGPAVCDLLAEGAEP